jgi:hypothetical protein
MRLRQISKATPLVALVMSIGAALIMLPFSLIDYDRFHDGWMLTSAVAVHSGLAVHGEVFNQYGPLNPWLQGLALYMPVSPAVALRLFTVMLIAGIIFLLADMGRKSASGSPVSHQAGVVAATAWFVSSDIWGVGPVRPWPTFLFIFLLMLSFYLGLRAWAIADRDHGLRARVLIVGSGAALGLAFYTRVASGVVMVIILGGCATTAFLLHDSRKRVLLWGLAGFSSGVVSVYAVLLASGTGADFVYDTVTWPLEFFSGAANLAAPMSFTWLALTHFGPALLVGFFTLRVGQRAIRTLPIGSVLAAVVAGGALLATLRLTTRLVSSTDDFAGYFSWGAGIMLLWTCVIVAIIGASTAIVIAVIRSRQLTPSMFVLLALVALALVGLQEVSPDYTLRHVWWSLPFGLLLVFSVMPKVSGSDHWLCNPLLVPIVAIASYSFYIGIINLQWPRVRAPSSSVAAGMYVDSVTSAQIAEDMKVLQRGLGDRKAVFLTMISDLSITRGTYSSGDAYFHCYLGSVTLMSRIVNAAAVVVDKEEEPKCSNLESDFLTKQGFYLSGATDRYSIYVRP